jgi:hypothetical protein
MKVSATKSATSQICKTLATSQLDDRHDLNHTTLTRQTISLFLDTIRPNFSDTQADPKGFKKKSQRTF